MLGDLDGDGRVAFTDFLIVSAHFGSEGTYEQGDLNCNGVINFPEKSTNFCFGGEKLDRLFVTASSRLYSIQTKIDGPSMIPGVKSV